MLGLRELAERIWPTLLRVGLFASAVIIVGRLVLWALEIVWTIVVSPSGLLLIALLWWWRRRCG